MSDLTKLGIARLLSDTELAEHIAEWEGAYETDPALHGLDREDAPSPLVPLYAERSRRQSSPPIADSLMANKVYIVVAEANGVPQTTDGMWFHVLAVFDKPGIARDYQKKVAQSGEWGQYEDEEGNFPLDSSDWQVSVYGSEVSERLPDVPEGYPKGKL